MKELFIILYALSCAFISGLTFADVKFEVGNIYNQSFGFTKKTLQEAQEIIDDNLSNDSWGKKERWEKLEDGMDESKYIEIEDVTFFGELQYRNCKLPQEYSILICDDEQTYNEGDPCKTITDDMKDKKQKKASDESSKAAILLKIQDGSAKLEDLVQLEKIERGL